MTTNQSVGPNISRLLTANTSDEQAYEKHFGANEEYSIRFEKGNYRINDFFAVDKMQVRVESSVEKGQQFTLIDCINAVEQSLGRPVFLCIGANGCCFNATDQSVPDKNATSAIFVIAWHESDKICYYAAGDGNPAIERTFAKGKFFRKDVQGEASLGTHHGAQTAFVKDFFYEMKPENYVVSAGTQYGHPCKFKHIVQI